MKAIESIKDFHPTYSSDSPMQLQAYAKIILTNLVVIPDDLNVSTYIKVLNSIAGAHFRGTAEVLVEVASWRSNYHPSSPKISLSKFHQLAKLDRFEVSEEMLKQYKTELLKDTAQMIETGGYSALIRDPIGIKSGVNIVGSAQTNAWRQSVFSNAVSRDIFLAFQKVCERQSIKNDFYKALAEARKLRGNRDRELLIILNQKVVKKLLGRIESQFLAVLERQNPILSSAIKSFKKVDERVSMIQEGPDTVASVKLATACGLELHWKPRLLGGCPTMLTPVNDYPLDTIPSHGFFYRLRPHEIDTKIYYHLFTQIGDGTLPPRQRAVGNWKPVHSSLLKYILRELDQESELPKFCGSDPNAFFQLEVGKA